MITPKVYYVMGASGVGKDSLLNFARKNLAEDLPVVFAHRYITRAPTREGENHIELSEQEFSLRENSGCFALTWQSHGVQYGIGAEVHFWLNAGLHVVISGSRAYFSQAIAVFPNLIPIVVTASPNIVRQRLVDRGRESTAEIEARLERAEALNQSLDHPSLVRIANNESLHLAGTFLVHVLEGGATCVDHGVVRNR